MGAILTELLLGRQEIDFLRPYSNVKRMELEASPAEILIINNSIALEVTLILNRKMAFTPSVWGATLMFSILLQQAAPLEIHFTFLLLELMDQVLAVHRTHF